MYYNKTHLYNRFS